MLKKLESKLKSIFHNVSYKILIGLLLAYSIATLIKNEFGYFDSDRIDPIQKYGELFAIGFYIFRMTIFLFTAPLSFISTWALIFSKDKPLKIINLPQKVICFRVVTRGLFPVMVKSNMKTNLDILNSFESLNYTYEVVTDTPIGIPNVYRCFEVLVPSTYTTKKDAKFKARALQFAIESNVSQLLDEDYIVHLDEESILTKECVWGIAKFVNDNKHQIGQGIHSYGKGKISNMFNTQTDSNRVANDLGLLRFSLKFAHCPLFYFKGSFFVCIHGVEKHVTFDHGFEGSIAEDAYFALKASNYGYTFDWIQGEMLENSPFTFMDLLRQRRRWFQGLFLVNSSRNIQLDLSSFFFKLNFISQCVFPLSVLATCTNVLLPVCFFQIERYIYSIHDTSLWFKLWIGITHSFDLNTISVPKKMMFFICTPIWMLYSVIAESLAVFWGFFTPIKDFQIVKKSFESKTD